MTPHYVEMAATNKCLAQSNKSRTRGSAKKSCVAGGSKSVMNPPFIRVSMNNCPEMPLTLQLANDLSSGPVSLFADWPNVAVSTFGAGVYTIWHSDGRFIYVGMSGRGITTETSRRNTPQGIYTRLQSHASGRRSGDQFCVYVADRLVLPALSQDDITAIASGRHQMDAFVRKYIHENLCYRFVMLPDGAAAYAVEAAIKNGKWGHGRPFLNPGR